MPPKPPNGRTDLRWVQLLPNQGLGFGFERTELGLDGTSAPEGYHRTLNSACRRGRELSPAFGSIFHYPYYASPIAATYPPSFLASWDDPTTGEAYVFFALYIEAWSYTGPSGTLTFDVDATTETYGGGAFHDNGGTTPYWYAGTFSSTTGAVQFLNRRNNAYFGTWAQDADVRAKFVVSAGGALWRTTSDYEISKCPANADPFTLGNWGSAIKVGSAQTIITGLAALGAVPIVLTTTGIWVYDEGNGRFENKYPIDAHPFNFQFVATNGAGGFLTSTANGDIVEVQQFGAIVVINPLEHAEPGRDTPYGRIEGVTTDGRSYYALMTGSYKLVQPSGLKLLKTTDNGGSYADLTANGIDQTLGTLSPISNLDTKANGDWLLLGFDDQFLAAQFLVDVQAYNGNTATQAWEISTGAGTWASVDIFDGTQRYSDATGLSQTFYQAGVVAMLPTSDISSWVKATYNETNKYWVRVSVSAALAANVQLAEVSIVVRRPAPDFENTNLNNARVWEASGLLLKVLRGQRDGNRIVWDDLYTLQAVGTPGRARNRTPGSNRVIFSRMPTANSPDGSLIVAARDEFYQLPLPYLNEPSLALYPQLARDASTQIAPAYYPSAYYWGGRTFKAVYFQAVGLDFADAADEWRFSYRMDERRAWSSSLSQQQGDCLIELQDDEGGRILHTSFQILDANATDQFGPRCIEAGVWVEDLDSGLEELPAQRAVQVPAEA